MTQEGLRETGAWPKDARTFGEKAIDVGADAAREVARTAALVPMGLASGAATMLRQQAAAGGQVLGTGAFQGVADTAAEAQGFLSRWSDPVGEAFKSGAPEGYDPQATDPGSMTSQIAAATSQGVLGVGLALTGPVGLAAMSVGYYGSTLTATDMRIRQANEENNRARVAAGMPPVPVDEVQAAIASAVDAYIEAVVEAASEPIQASAAVPFGRINKFLKRRLGKVAPFLAGSSAEGVEEFVTQAAQAAAEYRLSDELRAQHRMRAAQDLLNAGVNPNTMTDQEREAAILRQVAKNTIWDSMEAMGWGAVGGAAGHVVGAGVGRAMERADERLAGRIMGSMPQAEMSSEIPAAPKQGPKEWGFDEAAKAATDGIEPGTVIPVSKEVAERVAAAGIPDTDVIKAEAFGGSANADQWFVYGTKDQDAASTLENIMASRGPAAVPTAFIRATKEGAKRPVLFRVQGTSDQELAANTAAEADRLRAEGYSVETMDRIPDGELEARIVAPAGQQDQQAPAAKEPASDEERINAAIAFTARTKTPGDTISRVPDDALTEEQRKVVEAAKRLGRRAVFVKGTAAAKGFYSPMAPDVMFVNADPRVAGPVPSLEHDLQTLLHEDTHAVRHRKPVQFREIVDLLDPREMFRRAMPEIQARMEMPEGAPGALPKKSDKESWSGYMVRVMSGPGGPKLLAMLQEEGAAYAREAAAKKAGTPEWAGRPSGLRGLVQRANRVLVRAGLRGRMAQRILASLEQELANQEGMKATETTAPRAGILEPGSVVKDGTVAVMDADGRVFYDEAARMHGDLLERFPELDSASVIDGGFIDKGRYTPFQSGGGFSGREGTAEQVADVERFTAIVNGEDAPETVAGMTEEDVPGITDAVEAVTQGLRREDAEIEQKAAEQERSEQEPAAATEPEQPAAPEVAPPVPEGIVRAMSRSRRVQGEAFAALSTSGEGTPKAVRKDVAAWIKEQSEAAKAAKDGDRATAIDDAAVVMLNPKSGFMAAMLRRRRALEAAAKTEATKATEEGATETAAPETQPEAEPPTEAHPDPVAHAIQIALAAAPEGTMAAAFDAGFRHAVNGKTKSTLGTEEKESRRAGYAAGRAWIEGDGAQYATKAQTRKLEATGVVLRRWWEGRMDAAKKLSSSSAYVKAVLEANSRGALLRIESDNPFLVKVVAEIRRRMLTATDALTERLGTQDQEEWGDVDYRGKVEAIMANYRNALLAAVETIEGSTTAAEALKRMRDMKPEGRKALRAALAKYERSLLDDRGDDYWRLMWSESWDDNKLAPWSDAINYKLKAIIKAEAAGDTKKVSGPQTLVRPRLDTIEREGWSGGRQAGRDVTPDEVKEDFGLADIGFGKWVGTREDQDHLNYAYDALGDLADVLGIPPKAIGLGGTLHLTIGALGHGKHAAHYSWGQPTPDGRQVPVINLTNTRGDGTVAHEWAHALDYHIRAVRTNASPQHWNVSRVVSVLRSRIGPDGTRDFLESVARVARGDTSMTTVDRSDREGQIEAAIRYYGGPRGTATSYRVEALRLDGTRSEGKNAYWSNAEEMFARAFEAFVYDRMVAAGKRSDYLVNTWVGEGVVSRPTYRGTPYPAGEERTAFNELMAAFVDTIKFTDTEVRPVNAKDGDELTDKVKRFEEVHQRISGADALAKAKEDARRIGKEVLQATREEKKRKLAEKLAEDLKAAETTANEQVATSTPAPLAPDGPLSEDELSKLFDDATAQVNEANQEKPDADEPGDPGLRDRPQRRSEQPPANEAEGSPATPEETPEPSAEPIPPSAAAMIADAAKLGVTGVHEAMVGLAKLFGAGRVQMFPSGFDHDAYTKAVPHFRKALAAFQQAGATLADLFRMLFKHYGPGIKPYAIRFARDEGLSLDLKQNGASDVREGSIPGGDSGDGAQAPGGSLSTGDGGDAAGGDPGTVDPGVRGDGGGENVGSGPGPDHVDPAVSAGRPGGRRRKKAGGEPGGPGGDGGGVVAGGAERRSLVVPEGALERTGSWYDTAARNVEIIELVKALSREGRLATSEEQARIARYAGWGSSELANNLFPTRAGTSARRYNPALLDGGRWTALGERLRKAVSDDELNRIMQSTQYAHYTSETVTRGIWAALQRLGFTGGTVLEPGMGVGAFPLTVPAELANTIVYTGIERDPTTAAIAKQIHQSHAIRTADYIGIKLPPDHFDAAIGNPPFSDTKITGDPEYRAKRFMLHDFFFAKTIDRVRPGGVLAFVTSAGSLNKKDEAARQYLRERADLVGAIRLPRTAFDQSAGTEVVTDIIILRRREPGAAPAGPEWMRARPVRLKTSDGSEDTAWINEYFEEHPEMVLGTHTMTGTMYRANTYTVDPLPTGTLETQLAAAIARLPMDVMTPRATPAPKVELAESADQELRVFERDGQLMTTVKGVVVTLDSQFRITKKEQGFIRGLLPLLAAADRARDSQRKDLPTWETDLEALRKEYARFVKEHGRITAFTEYDVQTTDEEGNPITETRRRWINKRVFQHTDPRFFTLLSLEKENDDGEIIDGPLVTGRVLEPARPGRIETASDALAQSLADLGRLDVADVAKRFGTSETTVLHALGPSVFEDPFGGYVLREDYLSGDVVTKLEQAKDAAETNPAFRRNVEALETVQPTPVKLSDIDIRLGARWVPASVVTAFAHEVLNQDVSAAYDEALGIWKVNGNRREVADNKFNFPAGKLNGADLLEHALWGTRININKTVDDKRVPDVNNTAAVNTLLDELYEAFKEWVRSKEGGLGDRLAALYNEKRNRLVAPKPDGSHLQPPGLSLKFKRLYDYQKNAIWRIIRRGSTYLAHAVGAGKTLTMIISAMEQKRLGLISKPLFIVPIPVLQQFAMEFAEAYPSANIMVLEDEDMTKAKRQMFLGRMAAAKVDAVIMSHSAFQKIKAGPAAVERVLRPILDDLDEAIAKTEKRFRKRLEKRKEQIEEWFKAATTGENTDAVATFDELGVDFLYVDEAHEFRKLEFSTDRDQKQKKGLTPDGARRALDMSIKLSILRDRNPSRSHVLASGTPITNTIAELFTLQRYMQPDALAAAGLSSFDAWAAEFGRDKAGVEADGGGTLVSVTRFREFANMPELSLMVRQVTDVVTNKMLDNYLTRPTIIGGQPAMVAVDESPSQRGLRAWIKDRIRVSRKWKPSRDEPSNPDPIIAINNEARLVAIDPRFLAAKRGESYNDVNATKLETMIDQIINDYHRDAGIKYGDDPKPGASQIVFSYVGFGEAVSRNRGFDVRRRIMERLKAGGVNLDEVAWIWDYEKAADRRRLNRQMRDGSTRILFASPSKGGTGLNVQRRLRSLHYLSPPWFPSDVEQPMGRIIRQGNLNAEVNAYWYLTKGTYDQAGWDAVKRKAKFIQQFLEGNQSQRTIEELAEPSPYEMAAALAAGDPRLVELLNLTKEVEALEMQASSHYDNRRTLKNDATNSRADAQRYRVRAAQYRKAAEVAGPLPVTRETLGILLDGAPAPGETAGEQLGAVLARFTTRSGDRDTLGVMRNGILIQHTGTYRRDDYMLEVPTDAGPVRFTVRTAANDEALGVPAALSKPELDGLVTRIVNALNDLPKAADADVAEADRKEKDAERQERGAAVVWEKQPMLDEARQKRDALLQALMAEGLMETDTPPDNGTIPTPGDDETRLSRPVDPDEARRAIERSTGIEDTSRPTTEREALRGGLARQEKVAATAFRKGMKAGATDGVRERLRRAKAQLRARIDAKQAEVEDVRARLLDTLQSVGNRTIRGAYLKAVTSITTPTELLAQLERLELDLARSWFRLAVRGTDSLARKRLKKKVLNGLPIEYRQRIAAELAAAHVAAGKTVAGKGRRRIFNTADEYLEAADRITAHHEAALAALSEARLFQKAQRGLRGKTVAEAVVEIKKAMAEARPKTIPPPHGLTQQDPEAGALSALAAQFSDARAMTQKIEGGRKGILYHLLVRRMRNAETMKLSDERRFMGELDTLLHQAGFKGLSDATARLAGWLGRASQQTVRVVLAGATRTITMDQALGLIAMDADTLAHLSDGRHSIATRMPEAVGSPLQFEFGRQVEPLYATEYEIGEIRSQLPAELVALVEAAKELRARTTRDRLFGVARRLLGYEPQSYERQWPRVRNRDHVQEVALDATASQHVTAALENAGILQPRTGGSLPLVVRGFLETLIDTVDRELHIIHFAEPLRIADAVLRHPTLVQAMASRWGGSTNRNLRAFLHNSAGVNPSQMDPMVGALRRVQGNLIRAWLTLNFKTYLKQLGGLAKAAPYLRVTDLTRGIASASIGAFAPSDYERLHSLSGYFWKRHQSSGFARFTQNRDDRLRSVDVAAFGQAVAAAGRSIAAGEGDDALRNLGRVWDSIQFLNTIDRFMAVAVWHGFIREGQRRFPALSRQDVEKWAARRAEAVFRDTQNVSSPVDDTLLQARNKPVASLWFPLTSDPAKSLNMLAEAKNAGDAKGFIKVLVGIGLNIGWAALAGTALTEGIKEAVIRSFGDDDEARRRRRMAEHRLKVMDAAARDVLATLLPYGGDYLYSLGRVAVTGRVQRGGGSMLDDAAAAVSELVQHVASDLDGDMPGPTQRSLERSVLDYVESGLEIGALLTGQPFTPIYRMGIKGPLRALEEYGPDGTLRYWRRERDRLLKEQAAALERDEEPSRENQEALEEAEAKVKAMSEAETAPDPETRFKKRVRDRQAEALKLQRSAS